ncbi:MAG: FAD-dependent monooxygenase [Bacteroidia bacterium]|nr:FAD-dependent monooxygenase [Bacteroidia bacterium]MCF8428393.1 FAD-dependent monooxygenase [Bacteroidia bacterium]
MAEKINIIGGGLSGTLMAIYLAKRGFEINLFERRPDMRNNRISAGKSINLALSTRGLFALEKVGLDQEILGDAIPMYGRMIHNKKGELAYQPYGKEGQAINSVSRGRLNIRLLELADEFENITLHFETKCTDVNIEAGIATFEMKDGSSQTFTSDRIIGTDGAFAATRARMQMGDRFDYNQFYLPVGYKELEIPAGDLGEFKMEKNALHIWPRGAFMMIALPNPAGDFTCTLFVPFDGETSFNAIKTREDVEKFFAEEFPDATPMMPTLLEDYFKNPTSSLVTVRCYPWVKADKLALMGDAAHAVVPFYGQGMNCSFEDVVVMDECIEKYGSDWNKVFDEYQKLRKPNADAISELAIQNYAEMADKVGDKHFLHKKHIEHDLSDLYPDKFKSQYELTTFSLSPYKYALDQGKKNDVLLETIIAAGAEEKIKDPAYMETLWHLID